VYFFSKWIRIIYPIMCKEEIDMRNFNKDLDIYCEKVFGKEKIE